MFEGFTKAQVLAALFNYSIPVGEGWKCHHPVVMDQAKAESLLATQSYFDCLYGRPIKTSFADFPDLSSSSYELHNRLSFLQIEDHLKKGDPFPEPPTQKRKKEKVTPEGIFGVRIEIQKGSIVKYKWGERNLWGENLDWLVLDHMLRGSEPYLFNYGGIMNTMGRDGNTLHAVILTEERLVPGSVAYCRVVGLLETENEKDRDETIVVVPVGDPDMDYVMDISNVSDETRSKIQSFVSNHKEHEAEKFVKVGDFQGREVAEALTKLAYSSPDKKQPPWAIHTSYFANILAKHLPYDSL